MRMGKQEGVEGEKGVNGRKRLGRLLKFLQEERDWLEDLGTKRDAGSMADVGILVGF